MGFFDKIKRFFGFGPKKLDLESLVFDPSRAVELHTMKWKGKEEVAQAIVERMTGVNGDMFDMTHGDYMLQSMVGLQFAYNIFDGGDDAMPLADTLKALFAYTGADAICPHAGWISDLPTTVCPLPAWMPATYVGGNSIYGRVYRINPTALWGPDHKGRCYLGFRSDGGITGWKALKGLKDSRITDLKWYVLEYDADATDDGSAMIWSNHEKEFDIEICLYEPKAKAHAVILRFTSF